MAGSSGTNQGLHSFCPLIKQMLSNSCRKFKKRCKIVTSGTAFVYQLAIGAAQAFICLKPSSKLLLSARREPARRTSSLGYIMP